MDLLQFLQSRGLNEEYLRKLVDDKIDAQAMLAMDEDNRMRYIPSYGDRISAVAFCRAQIDATCDSVPQEGGQLLDRLRQKHIIHKKFGNRNAEKTKRRVELGWMDFNKVSKEFKQVRSQKGGGTRHLTVEKDCTLWELLNVGKNLFCLEKTPSYDIELRVACLHMVIDLNMTVHQCYELSKVKILRLYLYTKYLPGEGSQPSPSQQDVKDDELEADFDLPEITISRGRPRQSRSLSLYRRHGQSSDSRQTATCTAISNTVDTDTRTPNAVSATPSTTITPVFTSCSTVATDTLVTSSPGGAEIENLKEASTEEEMQTCTDQDSDWLLEQGLVPFGIKLEQKDEVVRTLLKHLLHYRVHSEICQFTSGLDQIGELYKTVLKAPGVMQPLFVNQGKLLSFESFRALYKVNYSPVGSNRRKGENDTIYCFEAFLMDCEGQTSGVTLEDVLAFWTGATTVPPMGFPKDLEIDFICRQTHCLPVAHTCGMSLDLNRGLTDPDRFQADMVKAITWTDGFHLC